jgi:flagellar hook-basal body complex protein FliE
MVNPISPHLPSPIGPPAPASPSGAATPGLGGSDFATQLRQQLEQVSHMQAEADAGVQNLLTGQTDNITQVFTTARKAEVAFSLLMEIRNKLVDAYGELKQLRV